MKTAPTTPARRKVIPSKDSLREAFTETTLALARTRTELDSTKEALVEARSHRDGLRARAEEQQKMLIAAKERVATFESINEDLNARLDRAQVENITMRANLQVERARGYIAGLQGEPFDQPPPQMVSCDTADLAGDIASMPMTFRHPLGDEERHMTPLEKARRLNRHPDPAAFARAPGY